MSQITVIIPIYKVEKYLCRCVESVLSQTFSDCEILLVDDGSTDGCGKICDKYAEQNNRIHVIHQQNGGLSAARNTGIDFAFACSDSKWLSFVDSDDWVHPLYLEILYREALRSELSVVICGFERVEDEVPFLGVNNPCFSIYTPEMLYIERRTDATIACAKLYKKECFTNTRYPVGKIHEDEFTTYKIIFRQNRVSFIPDALYYYFVNSESITEKNWTPQKIMQSVGMKEQLDYFIRERYDKAAQYCAYCYLWSVITHMYKAKENEENRLAIYLGLRLKLDLIIYRKHIRNEDYYPLFQKGFPILIKLIWPIKRLSYYIKKAGFTSTINYLIRKLTRT